MDNSGNALLLRDCIRVLLLVSMWSLSSAKADVANGDFEQIRDGLAVGWGGLWTRQKGAGSLIFDKEVRSKFVIPKNVSSIIPRVTGTGPAIVWVDDYALVHIGNIGQLRGKEAQKKLSVSNKMLTLTVDTFDGSFSVTDKRTGGVWQQRPFQDDKAVLEAAVGNGIEMTVLDGTSETCSISCTARRRCSCSIDKVGTRTRNVLPRVIRRFVRLSGRWAMRR